MAFLSTLTAKTVKIKERISNIAEEHLASDELAAKRLDICLSCQHLLMPTRQCKKCGCFTVAKTKLKNQKCPINKW